MPRHVRTERPCCSGPLGGRLPGGRRQLCSLLCSLCTEDAPPLCSRLCSLCSGGGGGRYPLVNTPRGLAASEADVRTKAAQLRVGRAVELGGARLAVVEQPAGPLLRSDELVPDAPRVLVVSAGELAVRIRRLARGAATIEPAVKVVVQQLVRVSGRVRVRVGVRVSGSIPAGDSAV